MNALEIMSLLEELKPNDLVDIELRKTPYGKDLTIKVYNKFAFHINDLGFCLLRLEGEEIDKRESVALFPIVFGWAKNHFSSMI